jgi:hypothetical protein
MEGAPGSDAGFCVTAIAGGVPTEHREDDVEEDLAPEPW